MDGQESAPRWPTALVGGQLPSKATFLATVISDHVRPGDTLYFGGSMARPDAALFRVAREFRGTRPGFTVAAPVLANQHVVLAHGRLIKTERIRFTAGIRCKNEDKDTLQFSDFGFIPPLQQRLNANSDAVTPRFAIELFPNEDTMPYASATRGFKSGGFTFNGFQSSFRPEFLSITDASGRQSMDSLPLIA